MIHMMIILVQKIVEREDEEDIEIEDIEEDHIQDMKNIQRDIILMIV